MKIRNLILFGLYCLLLLDRANVGADSSLTPKQRQLVSKTWFIDILSAIICKLTFGKFLCPSIPNVTPSPPTPAPTARCNPTPGNGFSTIKPIEDSAGLRVVFRAFINNPTSKQEYGATPNDWNVSLVTSMNGLFAEYSNFNADISCWDVGGVTDFSSMFGGALTFNQDIGGWNVGMGTDFSNMFIAATAFNQDIGGWNVGMGTNFRRMFFGATAFNQDIGGWNVGMGTSFEDMFAWAAAFNQDIGGWNVGVGTNFKFMFFRAAAFNQDIGGWNVGMGTFFNSMFSSASAFNQNLCSWGPKIQPGALAPNMFVSSNCTQQGNPDLTIMPRGPFCVACNAR